VRLYLPGCTTGVLSFVFGWGEFLFPNAFAFDQPTQPATVVIPSCGLNSPPITGQAAGAIAVTVPRVLLVLIFQCRIVSGLTAEAVK
jgi:multiple sugar transport system permease protein